ATHNDIRYASTILLVGGEPEEEQTFTAKQVRQAVRNSGAKFIIVNEHPINLARQSATQFIHINEGSLDAFALAMVDPKFDKEIAGKMGVSTEEIDALRKTLVETQGDLVIMIGNDLSPEAQAVIAANAASLN